MIRTGVAGAGHLGKIHMQLLREIEGAELSGFYDIDLEKAKRISAETGIKYFSSYEEMLENSDAIDIVTPTLSHYDCAIKAIEKNKHIFIEKPLTESLEEAEKLLIAVSGKTIKVQVGHIERFNPAFTAMQNFVGSPMFVESHRLAEFKPRGTDVSVVLDLMIHDIDILLSIVNSEVESVSASGVSVISDNVDIANARIEFYNGCVANLTSSRVSLKNERKMRIFQKNTYITLDFQNKEVNVFQLKELAENETPSTPLVIDPGNGKTKKEILYASPKLPETNALKTELEFFIRSIREDIPTHISLQDGYNSLKLAHQVLDKIDEQIQKANSFSAR